MPLPTSTHCCHRHTPRRAGAQQQQLEGSVEGRKTGLPLSSAHAHQRRAPARRAHGARHLLPQVLPGDVLLAIRAAEGQRERQQQEQHEQLQELAPAGTSWCLPARPPAPPTHTCAAAPPPPAAPAPSALPPAPPRCARRGGPVGKGAGEGAQRAARRRRRAPARTCRRRLPHPLTDDCFSCAACSPLSRSSSEASMALWRWGDGWGPAAPLQFRAPTLCLGTHAARAGGRSAGYRIRSTAGGVALAGERWVRPPPMPSPLQRTHLALHARLRAPARVCDHIASQASRHVQVCG